MDRKKTLSWILRIFLLFILYIIIWISGTLMVTHLDPELPSEPGLVNTEMGILILAFINTLLIFALIVTSKLRGISLAFTLGIAYYGVFTFLTQIETWYFLSEINVSKELLLDLFLMGLPIPLVFIPLAVFICGRWKVRGNDIVIDNPGLSIRELILKISVLAVVYVVLYWLAGYFIAWQNSQLREFYGSPGVIESFWVHTSKSLNESPDLFIFQLMRGVLFTVIIIPIIRSSNKNKIITSVLIGLFLAMPHLSHIISNPIIPNASVRLSHMIETFSSTFLFGVIIVWVLHLKLSFFKFN